MKPVPIGVRGEAEETVEFKHTLTAHHDSLPPVYSTPDMIRVMETAAFHCLQPYCEGDEISVGTAINIEHRAASGIGSKIYAEAVLESMKCHCLHHPDHVGSGVNRRQRIMMRSQRMLEFDSFFRLAAHADGDGFHFSG